MVEKYILISLMEIDMCGSHTYHVKDHSIGNMYCMKESFGLSVEFLFSLGHLRLRLRNLYLTWMKGFNQLTLSMR